MVFRFMVQSNEETHSPTTTIFEVKAEILKR